MTPGQAPCQLWTFPYSSLFRSFSCWAMNLLSISLAERTRWCRQTPRQGDAAAIIFDCWDCAFVMNCRDLRGLQSSFCLASAIPVDLRVFQVHQLCGPYRAEDMEVSVTCVVYWHNCLLLNSWPHRTNLSLRFSCHCVPLVLFGEHPACCQW